MEGKRYIASVKVEIITQTAKKGSIKFPGGLCKVFCKMSE